ncbi:hypothetical protein PTTG_30736, partial [Puccinia triticina 1-1 BBBD Race 1]
RFQSYGVNLTVRFIAKPHGFMVLTRLLGLSSLSSTSIPASLRLPSSGTLFFLCVLMLSYPHRFARFIATIRRLNLLFAFFDAIYLGTSTLGSSPTCVFERFIIWHQHTILGPSVFTKPRFFIKLPCQYGYPIDSRPASTPALTAFQY